MSKYKPLSEALDGRADGEWSATFAELEALLGFPLPKAARTTGAWWANAADKAHSRAWLDQGWRVESVHRAGETVIFRREQASPAVQPPAVKAAANGASGDDRIKRAAGKTALVGGVVAVVAGIAALAVRALRKRRA
jgi:hypothetical protein